MLRRRDLAVKGISTVLCSSLLTEDKPAQGLSYCYLLVNFILLQTTVVQFTTLHAKAT